MKNSNKVYYAIIMVLTVLFFHCTYGLKVVNPVNIKWLLDARHDWGQHYLGWAFYRNEPWGFPLGKIDALCYPSGTNVGFWDGIPLFALLFKPFSALFPQDFQYIGFWLLLCYLTTAHYSIKLFNLYNVKPVYTIIGVLLIVSNPVLMYRGMHPALCAHGFLLASLYYYLKAANKNNVVRINRSQIVILALSALTNPYITVMVVGFNFILPVKHYFYDKLLTKKQALLYPFLSCLSIVIVWFLLGMLTFSHGERLEVSDAYGMYSLNLNSLFNSSGFSTILPQMPWANQAQYEGFMYLGLGMMLLIAVSFIYFILKGNVKQWFKNNKQLLPLFVLAIGFTIFAVTNVVSYNSEVLFTVPFPKFLIKLGGIFRASGRFFWVPFYLILFFFIFIIAKARVASWIKIGFLIIVAAAQAYDTMPIFTFRNLGGGTYVTPLTEAKWNALLPHFKTIITYPPYNNHLLNNMDYQDLCYLALKNHNAISTGYSARENRKAYSIFTDELTHNLKGGVIHNDEVYVTTPQYLDAFKAPLYKNLLNIVYLDGYYILYAKTKRIKIVAQTAQAQRLCDSVNALYTKPRLSLINTTGLITNSGTVKFNIENVTVNHSTMTVNGWAYLAEKSNNVGDSVFVTINSGGKTYRAKTIQVARPDLNAAFKKEHLDNSGFTSEIIFNDEPLEDIVIGVAIKDKTGKITYATAGPTSDFLLNKPERISKLPPQDEVLSSNLETVIEGNDNLVISGWASIKGIDASASVVKIVFVGRNENFTIKTAAVIRKDVTQTFNDGFNHDNAGFEIRVNKADLPKGKYQIGIIVSNKAAKKDAFRLTDKKITVQ